MLSRPFCRTGRPLVFQLPDINSVQDLVAAMAKIATAVNNGDLTAEAAAHLVHCSGDFGSRPACTIVTLRL